MPFEDATAEQSMVSVCQNASSGAPCQVLFQPGFLRRAGTAPPKVFRIAIGVQHHNVPIAQLVTVVALARWPGLRSPILEIRRRLWIGILMIPKRWPGPVLELAPRRVVTILEVRRASSFVCQVAGRKNCPRDLFDQFGCSL